MRRTSSRSSTPLGMAPFSALLLLTSVTGLGLCWAQADPQGLFALSARNIDGVDTPLGEHNGKVALVVNLASE